MHNKENLSQLFHGIKPDSDWKLDGVAPFVADPTPTDSTNDTETHPISHG